MSGTTAFRISAGMGFLAVALGAFGAHALKDLLVEREFTSTWQTASFYHLVHAVVLCLVAGRTPFTKGAWWAFLVGMLLFSGSLYAMCLSNVRVLGAITPMGGISLLLGWAWLVCSKK